MLGALILFFLLYRAIYSERDDARYYIFQGIWEDKIISAVTGEVERITLRQNQEKERSTSIYLRNCRIRLENREEDVYSLRRLLVYCDGMPALEPGNTLDITGSLQELSYATNPGQFDQRRYYREKGIYYQLQAQSFTVTDRSCIRWKSSLYHIRNKMAQIYQCCLPVKEGGVVTAMILGDKSVLDMDVKKLYQESGIGHLLAISGLHVTILGMAFYRLLRLIGVPVRFAAACAVLALLCYGTMTDFSISTSRAVIMMILYLVAEGIGRTYDGKSALAFSGIVILLQKPFALFSCSFLLSFGAIAGIELLFPMFQFLVYGEGEKARKRRRRNRRRNREIRENYRFGRVMIQLFSLGDKAISMLLASLSIQLMIFPVMLFYFYEIPVYGIIINLLVIPLASFVVLLSFLGGALGCVVLPLGKMILGSVYYLLQFYEWICGLFQQLPGHMQILGRPAQWKILVYYSILLLFCGGIRLWKKIIEDREGQIGKGVNNRGKAPWMFAGVCCLAFLFIPISPKIFQMTMLDVGQGDGIFLHTAAGQDILVDGGSTSVSNVGKYRILPFLKYSGVRKIDYIVMSHWDEDHINGLLTVLEESGGSGPKVRQLVVPHVADRSEEGYQKIITLAEEKEIEVVYLWEGHVLQSGELSLTCLNPVKNMETESANAASVTFSLKYKSFSCLLTGDLEGDGQEYVKKILEQRKDRYVLPFSYTVLKVAHHGSKNSTDEGFLQRVSPQISLISCGKNNRYGHPHTELLERLRDVESAIYQTPQCGAVTLHSDGKYLKISTYQSSIQS